MKSVVITIFSAAVIAAAVVFSACRREPIQPAVHDSATPVLPAQPYSYTLSVNNDIATLGRVLFYDPKLSLNNSVSCGSCHKQVFAFSDNKAFSQGLEGVLTKRNVSTLINDNNSSFWDGRAAGYQNAVLQPVQNHAEMKIYDLNLLVSRLSRINYYPSLFAKAFDGDSSVTVEKIQEALSNFVDNIVSRNSKYDLSINNPSGPSLTALEKEGKALFTGRGMCSNCHTVPDFSGWMGGFANIGLETVSVDRGRGAITNDPSDDGKFKIPSLRNVALSAPYMHDGRYKTLKEVISHYSDGIQPHPNLDWEFKDLSGIIDPISGQLMPGIDPEAIDFSALPVKQKNFSDHEKEALEAFLLTLTDYSVITDVKFSNPFKIH